MTQSPLPPTTRMRCPACGRRRMCWAVRVNDVPGDVHVWVCDDCLFDLAYIRLQRRMGL